MVILGINAYHADSSAAIFRDGAPVAAAEEERFTRVKHWAGFPERAIAFCLGELPGTIDDVDHIAIGRDPTARLGSKLLYLARHPARGWRTVRERLRNAGQVASVADELARFTGRPAAVIRPRIRHVEHHRSHLAAAFFASPYEEAALLSIDGSGDFTTTMIGVGRGTRIEVLDSIAFPVSAGTFYTAFTQHLGFWNYGDEYKVMGLAAYGEPCHVDKLSDVIHLTPDGLFTWNDRYFTSALDVVVTYGDDHVPRLGPLFTPFLEERFGRARQPGEELTQHHKDLAASVQKVLEQLVLHVVTRLRARTGLRHLCLAGGVAQNSVAVGKILAESGFEGLYVPPAPHDAGIALGSALHVAHHRLGRPRAAAIRSACLGSRFANADVARLLTARGVPFRMVPDDRLFAEVAERIERGGVVGWFQGRAEFGPRALGARSILADPRRADARELLNERIKRRETFRPFAPAVLAECVGDYFERAADSPFMERVVPIRPNRRPQIPAVTHVDGTGRVQSVHRDEAPRFHALIAAFRDRTGVPILLNTSFNENEPIVNTPAEALDCFLRTEMDMLVLENCVLER
jgi:carbamoyltransferase